MGLRTCLTHVDANLPQKEDRDRYQNLWACTGRHALLAVRVSKESDKWMRSYRRDCLEAVFMGLRTCLTHLDANLP